jgi:uncharacterized protein (DUF1330 family)
MYTRAQAGWNAAKAVLIVFVGAVIFSYFGVRFMRAGNPCQDINSLDTRSPDGAYVARNLHRSCKVQGSEQQEIQVAIAPVNPSNGKAEKYGTVFACTGLSTLEMNVQWASTRKLLLTFPEKKATDHITAQQPKYRDVEIEYRDSEAAEPSNKQ